MVPFVVDLLYNCLYVLRNAGTINIDNVTTQLAVAINNYLKQEALQMQRDHATSFVTRNNKSNLQTHSRSLVFVPFDRPYIISY